MTRMIAFCGLDCARCGAYLATQADDDELRAATAREWSERHGIDIPPDPIIRPMPADTVRLESSNPSDAADPVRLLAVARTPLVMPAFCAVLD